MRFFVVLLLISSFAHANAEKEAQLANLDFNTHTLKKLKAGNTTPNTWKVKDPSGKTIANLKCTSGNTNHQAAITVYELSKVLNIEYLYPVAVERSIDFSEMHADEDLSQIKSQKCALKEWITNPVVYFWKNQASDDGSTAVNTFKTSNDPNKKMLTEALSCDSHLNMSSEYEFFASEGGSKYFGQSELGPVAKDFSTIMLIDALIGNDDRFPGGNLHLISAGGPAEPIEGKESSFTLKSPQLFSLDNEAALKRIGSLGMRDFKTYVSRFDRDLIGKLRNMQKDLEKIHSVSDLPAKYKFLDFYLLGSTKKSPITGLEAMKRNLVEVLAHVDKSEKRCGSETWF